MGRSHLALPCRPPPPRCRRRLPPPGWRSPAPASAPSAICRPCRSPARTCMTQHQSNEWQQARKSATTMSLFPRHIMLVGPSFVQSCARRQNGVHIKQPQADRVICACKIDLRRGREAHHSGFVLYDDAPFPGCDSLPAGCACLFQHLNPLCLFQGLRWEKNWIIPSLTSIAEFSICCLHASMPALLFFTTRKKQEHGRRAEEGQWRICHAHISTCVYVRRQPHAPHIAAGKQSSRLW